MGCPPFIAASNSPSSFSLESWEGHVDPSITSEGLSGEQEKDNKLLRVKGTGNCKDYGRCG